MRSIKMKKLLFAFCTVFLALQSFAQPVAPAVEAAWTSGLKQATWQPIVKRTVFAPQAGGAAFYSSLNPAVIPDKIATTADNWIYHVVDYSKVFSKPEKAILLPRGSEAVTLGKVAFLHDRSAAVYNQLQKEPNPQTLFRQHAFDEHQLKLVKLGRTLENDLVQKVDPALGLKSEKTHEDFVSLLQKWPSGFERSDIAYLVQSGGQPLFPVMSQKEIEQFAALKDLSAQRDWVAQQIDAAKANRRALLSREVEQLTDNDFRLYYMQNLRLQYLEKFQNEVLSKATAPRKSLIYRNRAKLSDDLPLMTDAERLGYLQHRISSFQGSLEEKLKLQTQLAQQKRFYQPYAAAQAFGVPYEQVLKEGYMNPKLLGEETARFIQNSTNLEKDLAPAIEKLDARISAMNEFEPEELSFCSQYYRLTLERDIYKAEIARRRFFNTFRR